MVDSCCAPGCKHNRGESKGRAFYRIPKDPERRQRWISAIKQARSEQKKTKPWEPKHNGFRLCSDHFISGKKSDNPLSPDYIPSIFKHMSSPEKRRKRLLLDVFNREQKSRLQRREQAKKSSAAEEAPSTHMELENDSQPVPDDNNNPTTLCSSENSCEFCQRRKYGPDFSSHRFPGGLPSHQAEIDRVKMLEECVDPFSGKPAYEMIQCDPDWVPSLHLGHTEVDVANSNDPYQQKTKKLQAPAPVSDKQFTEDCKGKSMKSLTKWRRRRQILYTGWQPVTRRISQVHNSSHAAEVRHDHDYSKNPQSEQATQTELDHLEEGVLNSNRVLLQRLQFEPELITFYTGFKDYSTLKAFYSALQPTPEIIWKWKRTLELSYTERSAADYGGFPEQRLCLFDQLFLFLCFVRRGFLPVDVSKQLMSEDVVRTTYVTWCHYLFFMLGALPIWSTRQTVDELMPPFFRTTFPKTRVVLDMTEIHVQPPAHKAKSSHHKASKTLKSLFGVSPSGAISFVSGVFSSSVSDEDVIRESGILNLLEPGDKVMADKSLDVGDVLDVIAVNFVTPTFSWPNGQLNKDNMTHTQDISCLKIHVARAISRVKEYHIFDDVPSALCGSVSQLWTVCALLTNFHGPLV